MVTVPARSGACRRCGPSALALAARFGCSASSCSASSSARLSFASARASITTDADIVPPAPPISAADLATLREFVVAHPKLCLLTGAGMSTESGIPDYRSPNGSYSKGHKPITWQQFSRTEASRQRYWARSMAGWQFMDQREPNLGHAAVAELERLGRVTRLITQNVDRLHHRAGSTNVCELHGTIFEVECAGCGAIHDRDDMQAQLKALNPHWADVVEKARRQLSSENAPFAKREPGADDIEPSDTNRPDGDVELDGVDYSTLSLPPCASSGCDGFLKPGVVLFGENVPKPRVQSAMDSVLGSDALLILGTSVQVYSAFRFVKACVAEEIPVCIVNAGPTRADPHADLIINATVGDALPKLLVELRRG